MTTLLALFATLVRLVKPSQAAHATPFGRVGGILEELRRNRSRRVRRYAANPPLVLEAAPCATPAIPSPRKPAENVPAPMPRVVLSTAPVPTDYVPVVDASSVAEPAVMVRGYYREWERRKAERYADQQRLGVAVLCDVATTPKAGV